MAILSNDEVAMGHAGLIFGELHAEQQKAEREIRGDLGTVQAYWKSESSTKFQGTMNQWSASYTEIINELASLNDSLAEARARLVAAEGDNLAMINGFDGAYDGMII